MVKKIRISLLLFILFLVAWKSYLTHERVTDWDQSLVVVIYPINADGNPLTAEYISRLTKDAFLPIARFMGNEGSRYSLSLVDPLLLEMAPEISSRPPAPPFGANVFAIMWWSLHLRYWVWQNDTYQGPLVNIRVFMQYYTPNHMGRYVHSTGLKKGHICLVQGFAGRQQEAGNNVIIAHEILHTLGATDKYDLKTLQPIYPEGYADPAQKPLLPQTYAEIMAGAIPLSVSRFGMVDTLARAVIGPRTAGEINWHRENTGN